MWLTLGVGSFLARRNVRLFRLDLSPAMGLVQGGGGNQVLYDGAVARKFVLRMGILRCGFGDDFFQKRVLEEAGKSG